MVLTQVARPATVQGGSEGLTRAGLLAGGCHCQSRGPHPKAASRSPDVAADLPRANDPRDSKSEASVSLLTERGCCPPLFSQNPVGPTSQPAHPLRGTHSAGGRGGGALRC